MKMTGRNRRWTKAAKVARAEKQKHVEDKYEEKDENSDQSAQQLPVDNKLFEEYYVSQGIVSEEELEMFKEHMIKPLPLSFRLSVCKSNVQELCCVLNQYFLPKLTSQGSEGGILQPLTSVPWLKDECAWQLRLDDKCVKENKVLQEFNKFLYQETECGNIVQQDVAGMLPALLLDVRPDSKVLDLRASPGHRATHLLELLHSSENVTNPGGIVIANETHLKRCFSLSEQIRRYFSPNFAIVNMDANNLPSLYLSDKKDPEPLMYDRIVCGFPSSGDGLFRNNLDGLRCWTANVPLSHHGHLTQMLYSGMSSLAIGGRLVFVTYSMNPVEAEAVVYAVIMQQRGTVELEDVSQEMPKLVYEKGLHSWRVMAKGPRWFRHYDEVPEHLQAQIWLSMFPPAKEEAERVGLDKCIRILPHKQDTVGLFMAVFKRTSSLYEAWQREQEEQQKMFEAAAKEQKLKEQKQLKEKNSEEEKNLEEEPKKKDKENPDKDNEDLETVEKQNVGENDKEMKEDKEEEKEEDNKETKEEKEVDMDVENKLEAGDSEITAEKATDDKDATEDKDTGDEGKDGMNERGRKESMETDEWNRQGRKRHSDYDGTEGTDLNSYWNSTHPDEDGGIRGEADEGRKSRIEGKFLFLNAEDKIWLQLKDFYGITDDFPFTQVTCRPTSGLKLHYCFVTDIIKKLIEVNQSIYSFVCVGVKIFTHVRKSKVAYRLAQEGLSVILPYMTKRIVSVPADDFITILSSHSPTDEGLSLKTKEELTKLEPGGFVFVVAPDNSKHSYKSSLAVSSWKDENSTYHTFIPAYQRLHYLHVVGADMKYYEEKPDAEEIDFGMAALAKNFAD